MAGAVGAAIGTPVVMALFAKIFPAKKTQRADLTLDELRPRYQKWEGLFTVIFLVACVPIALVLAAVFRHLAVWHSTLLPPASVTLITEPIYWLLPAMFLSMVCAAPIITVVERRVLKDRYHEYEQYEALKHPYDKAKVSRVVGGGIIVASGLAIFLGLNFYLLVTDDELVVHRLLSIAEDRHPIHSIESIRTAPTFIAPNGNIVHRREYLVSFWGGYSWSTAWLPADLNDGQKHDLVYGLATQSGVPVREVDAFQKGEL